MSRSAGAIQLSLGCPTSASAAAGRAAVAISISSALRFVPISAVIRSSSPLKNFSSLWCSSKRTSVSKTSLETEAEDVILVLRQLPDLHALSIPRHNLQGARAAGRNVPRYALGGLGSCPECLGWQSNRCGTVKQNEQSPDLVQISFANRGLALTHRLQE